MTKEEYYKYLKSKDWSDIKLDLIHTRGNKCERCGNKRKHFRYLHIHHLTYRNIGNEKPEDLEILCAPCHRKEHGIEKHRRRNGKTPSKRKITQGHSKKNKLRYIGMSIKYEGVKCFRNKNGFEKWKSGDKFFFNEKEAARHYDKLLIAKNQAPVNVFTKR